MKIQIKVSFKDELIEAVVDYEKGTVQKLPDIFPFNQNVYLSGDDGISLKSISILEDGQIEYCRSRFNVPIEGSILSPFKDERLIFHFRLINE